jgi:copper amine oxidase-like protein
MNSSTTRRLSALAATALLTTVLAVPAAAGGPVTVQVNGQTLNLNPSPTERAGRVFVPLRGIFENLGASVVYEAGVINASGRGHSVSLKIGSQQATVDGQQQTIDVAPFIIGASTYVPLRFVSQALGANVNYDGANRIVAISASGVNAPPNQTITPAPNPNAAGGAINITNLVPARGASVSSRRPTIEATFAGGNADPNSVRVSLDGADVTADSTRSPHFFSYAPRSPLQAGEHTVLVRGTDTNGGAFNRGWRFTSGTAASVGQITNVHPANGATVGRQFTISGRTTPGARVTIQIGAAGGGSNTIGGLIGAILGGGGNQGNTASYTITADGNGNFAQGVSINAPSGTQLAIAINATDTQTGATATPVQEQVIIQ